MPWLVDDQSVEVVRAFARLKCRLMPYLYRAAVEASQSGVPMMRAMLLEFPDDPTAAFLDRQYMLGESLLVAPIFVADGQVTYYVPAGRWTHLVTGATLQGPGWIQERHDFSSLPLLVRPGSVIAMGARSDRADYDFADGVTLRAYELAEGVKVAVAVPDVRGGTRFRVRGDPGCRGRRRGARAGVKAVAAHAGQRGVCVGGNGRHRREHARRRCSSRPPPDSHRIEIRLPG